MVVPSNILHLLSTPDNSLLKEHYISLAKSEITKLEKQLDHWKSILVSLEKKDQYTSNEPMYDGTNRLVIPRRPASTSVSQQTTSTIASIKPSPLTVSVTEDLKPTEDFFSMDDTDTSRQESVSESKTEGSLSHYSRPTVRSRNNKYVRKVNFDDEVVPPSTPSSNTTCSNSSFATAIPLSPASSIKGRDTSFSMSQKQLEQFNESDEIENKETNTLQSNDEQTSNSIRNKFAMFENTNKTEKPLTRTNNYNIKNQAKSLNRLEAQKIQEEIKSSKQETSESEGSFGDRLKLFASRDNSAPPMPNHSSNGRLNIPIPSTTNHITDDTADTKEMSPTHSSTSSNSLRNSNSSISINSSMTGLSGNIVPRPPAPSFSSPVSPPTPGVPTAHRVSIPPPVLNRPLSASLVNSPPPPPTTQSPPPLVIPKPPGPPALPTTIPPSGPPALPTTIPPSGPPGIPISPGRPAVPPPPNSGLRYALP